MQCFTSLPCWLETLMLDTVLLVPLGAEIGMAQFGTSFLTITMMCVCLGMIRPLISREGDWTMHVCLMHTGWEVSVRLSLSY